MALINSALHSTASFLWAQPPFTFLVRLLGSLLSCWILGKAYKKFGRTVSDRNTISLSVIYLGLMTTFIISIVQSSVALSLGLVGSLSIVRFRTPVKEPEELLILFAAIGIGVGFGAGEILMTLLALATFLITMIILNLKQPPLESGAVSLHIAFKGEEPKLNTIIEMLEPACIKMDLMRMDHREKNQSLSFRLVPKNLEVLSQAQASLRELNESLSTSMIDYQPLQ